MPQPDFYALIHDLGSGDKVAGWEARKTMSATGIPPLPVVLDVLRNRPELEQTALSLIRSNGRNAQEAFPDLVRLLNRKAPPPETRPNMPDTYEFVLADIIGTIGSIGHSGSLELLLPFLAHPNYLSQRAAHALGDLGDARAVMPLAEVLADENKFWVPRSAAASALGQLGVLAREGLPALHKAKSYDTKNAGEKWDERALHSVEEAIARIESGAEHQPSARGFVFEDPLDSAEEFIETSAARRFRFDYSRESLATEMDRFLEFFVTQHGSSRDKNADREKIWRMAALLTAYIGETVRRLYAGKWVGSFSVRGANFYTCSVMAGNCEFWPSHFIEYYIANGKKGTGSFRDHLLRWEEKLRGDAT